MGAEAKAARRTRAAGAGFLPGFVRRHASQFGIVGVALVVWLAFLLIAPQTFRGYAIYNSFMVTTPYFALMAIPLTLVVITGEIDLSFPSVMAWGMVVYAAVFSATQNTLPAFVAALAAGALVGWTNGLLVTKIGIPSLVATLGTSFFWRGVVLWLRAGRGESLVPSKGSLVDVLLVGRLFDRIPAQFIWTILVAIAIWVLLNRTRLGAHTYLTGDNIESARLMGVDVDRVKILCFAIVGLFAALAGVAQSLALSYFWPTIGDGQLLYTLASVFLGGTSVFGGMGTVFGTFVASFVIGSINAGLVAGGIADFATQVFYGLIIVISVGVRTVLSRRLR